jgi:transketolase
MDDLDLAIKAYELRIEVIKMLAAAGSGHSAGPLGLAEIFACLYFNVLNHDPKNPDWEDRDRLVLSNGHVCPIQYAALADSGYFPKSYLKKLRKFDSPLQGHPERTRLPGIETTSGPLGSGLAQAAGIAAAAKLDDQRFRVYCITSDGEHQEGNHWEAVNFAAKYALSNLTVFVDRNHIQISGKTEDVMPIDPLKQKYESFNWNVIEVDGHDVNQILAAVEKARGEYTKPTVIITHTTPGKGVGFMQDDYAWHGRAPNSDQADQAIKELRRKLNDLIEQKENVK